MGVEEGGIIKAVQDKKAAEPNVGLDALQSFGDELWKQGPNSGVMDIDKALAQIQTDKAWLKDNFTILDRNEDGKVEIQELVDLKLTGKLPSGKEGTNFLPHELASIERLYFNPHVRGQDKKAGLSLEDVDLEIDRLKKPAVEPLAGDVKPAPPIETTPAPPPDAEANKPAAPAPPDAQANKPATPAPPDAQANKPATPPPPPEVEIQPPPAPPPEFLTPPDENPPIPMPVAEAPNSAPEPSIPPAPDLQGQEINYGYTKLSFGKNAQNDLTLIKEGDKAWEKRADNKWYDTKTNLAIAGQMSLLPDGSFKHDIKEGVYITVSPVRDGSSRQTIHRSNGTEVSAVYKDGQKQPSEIIEYATANPYQRTIWQKDATNSRIWTNGNQVRYDLTLQSNGNLTYSVDYPQIGLYQGRRVVSNSGIEMAQGLDARGNDGVPRYTFDAWGRITQKEYSAGDRQNSFSFVYKPDGSTEAIGMTYQERHWNDKTNQPEAYKTMSYSQVNGDQWRLTTNGAVSGDLYFKPLLSADGRVGTLHFENGLWVQSDHDLMTRTYLTANAQQPQQYYQQQAQPAYNQYSQRRRGFLGRLFRRA